MTVFQDGAEKRGLVITIDGPAGAGKTTVSKLLAERLGYRYVDTGALYRAVAYAIASAGLDIEDDPGIEALLDQMTLALRRTPDGARLFLDGMDISDSLRAPRISMLASAASTKPRVRSYLLKTQRDMGKHKGVVLEGRDMGTVVFPDAEIKFYLDADHKIRARRRHAELTAAIQRPPSLTSVEKDMRRRDQNDSSRQLAPLKPAPDAVRIDSTRLTADEVVQLMVKVISERFPGVGGLNRFSAASGAAETHV